MALLADIANTVESTVLKNGYKDVATGLAEQIIDIMQQSEDTRLTEDQVRQVKKVRENERSSAILKCVSEADKGVKAGFAFALFAVDPVGLAKKFPDLHDQVSKSAVKQFIKVGGARIQKEAFRNALKKNLACEKKEIAIVVVGRSGVGKSTLTNTLVGPRKLKEEKAKVGHGEEPCSATVEDYRVSLNETSDLPLDLVVWDTPGLHDVKKGDRTGNSQERTRMRIKELVTKVERIDLVIFCLDSTNPRLSEDTNLIIKTLSNAFGRDIWKHSLFALTKANTLRSPEDEAGDIEQFRETVSSIKRGTQELIRKHGIKPEVVEDIPFIPVGTPRDRVLADGKSWLSEFWVTAVERATVRASCFLLMYNELRVAVRSSDKRDERYELSLTDNHAERIAIIAPRLTKAGAGTYVAIFTGGIGVSAAAGAVIGAPFGGPIGAAIGAGIGAGVGALGSAITSLVTYIKQ